MSPYDYYITPEEYEAAAVNGISRQTLDARVRSYGWDKQRAITEALPPKRPHGQWCKVAETNGISDSTYYDRVNRMGWQPERAATEPPCKNPQALAAASRRRIPAKYRQLAAANGISMGTYRARVNRLGWTPERAATEPTWTREQVRAYGLERYKATYGGNPKAHLFPHRKAVKA